MIQGTVIKALSEPYNSKSAHVRAQLRDRCIFRLQLRGGLESFCSIGSIA